MSADPVPLISAGIAAAARDRVIDRIVRQRLDARGFRQLFWPQRQGISCLSLDNWMVTSHWQGGQSDVQE